MLGIGAFFVLSMIAYSTVLMIHSNHIYYFPWSASLLISGPSLNPQSFLVSLMYFFVNFATYAFLVMCDVFVSHFKSLVAMVPRSLTSGTTMAFSIYYCILTINWWLFVKLTIIFWVLFMFILIFFFFVQVFIKLKSFCD